MPGGFDYEEVAEILRLIETSDAAEIYVEIGELKLHVVRKSLSTGEAEAGLRPPPTDGLPAEQIAAPVAQVLARSATGDGDRTQPPAQADPNGCVPISAPMVGVFYRAPAPDAPPFVDVGTVVGPTDQVATIEVMKLMNEIVAGVSGVVVRIDAENEQLVEHGETLMWIEPD
jgi:acetyl-CoA carboxylase biotin carboxyl carrier protein